MAIAVQLDPEPRSFEPDQEGRYSFAFLAFDTDRVCRIPCDSSDPKEARREARQWLRGTYWRDDGTAVAFQPVYWDVFLGPNGEKLGRVL